MAIMKNLSRGEKILAIALGVVFLLIFYLTLDAGKYSAQVLAVEGKGRVGLNPTTERLDFGDLSPGTSAMRRIEIKNESPIPMRIVVFRFGAVSDLIDLNKNYFVLKPDSEEKIEFSVFMPASAEIGKLYKGRVFVFKIPFL